ncbi:hypothetical protein FA951_13460 [Dermacoccus nishinomiyaensis]|uniref:hypothetical protein n=1 Tax=Dermacoccus nishinomiyaensis TaxID=1274 RepID=UPI0010AB7BBB|nr:hypothetical protein [Dermacoccus nishinomiyaensis]TJZ94889.1 hypothetical protein FA951_13460 [Dermacoccus nishinomiyaensis]
MSSTSKPDGVRAWIDESGSDHRLDPGTYILAAAITKIEREDDVRRAMEELRLPGQKKLHWRDESHRRQRHISATVAGLKQAHLVVVRTSDPSDTMKRRRNKCLEHLLVELETRGATQATFESRGPADDRRDLELVQALRGVHRLGSGLRIHHQPGPSEPLLWIPDAICGAVTSARTSSTEYLDALGEQVSIIHI